MIRLSVYILSSGSVADEIVVAYPANSFTSLRTTRDEVQSLLMSRGSPLSLSAHSFFDNRGGFLNLDLPVSAAIRGQWGDLFLAKSRNELVVLKLLENTSIFSTEMQAKALQGESAATPVKKLDNSRKREAPTKSSAPTAPASTPIPVAKTTAPLQNKQSLSTSNAVLNSTPNASAGEKDISKQSDTTVVKAPEAKRKRLTKKQKEALAMSALNESVLVASQSTSNLPSSSAPLKPVDGAVGGVSAAASKGNKTPAVTPVPVPVPASAVAVKDAKASKETAVPQKKAEHTEKTVSAKDTADAAAKGASLDPNVSLNASSILPVTNGSILMSPPTVASQLNPAAESKRTASNSSTSRSPVHASQPAKEATPSKQQAEKDEDIRKKAMQMMNLLGKKTDVVGSSQEPTHVLAPSSQSSQRSGDDRKTAAKNEKIAAVPSSQQTQDGKRDSSDETLSESDSESDSSSESESDSDSDSSSESAESNEPESGKSADLETTSSQIIASSSQPTNESQKVATQSVETLKPVTKVSPPAPARRGRGAAARQTVTATVPPVVLVPRKNTRASKPTESVASQILHESSLVTPENVKKIIATSEWPSK
eukprot:ANDGO_04872.mRNA.1 hypothetical protein